MTKYAIHKDVKFSHNVTEGITLCYRINDADQQVEYAFAYKHPTDPYNHKIARMVSQGRLLTKSASYYGKITMEALKQATDNKINHRSIADYLDFIRSTDEHLITAAGLKKIDDMLQSMGVISH